MYQIGELSHNFFIWWATCDILAIVFVISSSKLRGRTYQRRCSIKGKAKPHAIDGKSMLELHKKAEKSSDGFEPHRIEDEKETCKKLVMEDI